MEKTVTVAVPATSANVGVGFDTLGIALNWEAVFSFTPADHSEITGCEERFRGEDNLVLTSYRGACRRIDVKPVPVHININSSIPLSGGLGSSSACVVAGIMGAERLAGRPHNKQLCLDIATTMEGHPDNVAPAILGGLVSSFVNGTTTTSLRFDIADSWRFVALSPHYEVRTADARQVVPMSVPTELAVWQMGRIVATIRALETGDEGLLEEVNQDRLHEPYRSKLIPDYEQLRERSLEAGACSFIISGSGSTMLAICGNEDVAQDVVSAVKGMVEGLQVRICAASATGAHYLE